jgi:hypothetical protein
MLYPQSRPASPICASVPFWRRSEPGKNAGGGGMPRQKSLITIIRGLVQEEVRHAMAAILGSLAPKKPAKNGRRRRRRGPGSKIGRTKGVSALGAYQPSAFASTAAAAMGRCTARRQPVRATGSARRPKWPRRVSLSRAGRRFSICSSRARSRPRSPRAARGRDRPTARSRPIPVSDRRAGRSSTARRSSSSRATNLIRERAPGSDPRGPLFSCRG